MLTFPAINPVALQLGPLQIHWYGLMYVLGFVGGWLLALYRAKHSARQWTSEQVGDLIAFAALGVIIGGRLGYMLIYDHVEFFNDPLTLFQIWHGGMSFHGGLIGVLLAIAWYGRTRHKSFFEVADFIAPLVPVGLGAGRIGNFINGELWGRVTTLPWGIVYPNAGPLPRHPSELYEFFLEGVVLFVVLWWYSSQTRPRMATSALFLILYGCFRFLAEFFRQPDQQMGFVAFNWLTTGQLLSLPMIIAGIILWLLAHRTVS